MVGRNCGSFTTRLAWLRFNSFVLAPSLDHALVCTFASVARPCRLIISKAIWIVPYRDDNALTDSSAWQPAWSTPCLLPIDKISTGGDGPDSRARTDDVPCCEPTAVCEDCLAQRLHAVVHWKIFL